MRLYAVVLKLLLPLLCLVPACAVKAQICQTGSQDSSCVTPLHYAPQVQPQCSSAAGWTTVTPSSWKGSYYSTPVCNYQPPPPGCSTGPGWTTIANPTWTGSSWTDAVCQYTSPPPGCSTAAGWTTSVASQWTGSAWTAAQCVYTAPPSCPGGYTQTGPTWDGSQWVSLSCTPTAPPDPSATCSSAVPSVYSGNITWQAAYAQGAANTAAVNNISGYATALASNRFYGPAYQSICSVTYYTYGGTCYLNSDGSLNALLVFPDSAGNTGGCMH